MDIDASIIADVVILRLRGEFKQRKDLLPVFLSYFRKGQKKFVLVFDGVTAINSVGLQTLIELHRMAETIGGGLRICNLKTDVVRALKSSRIDEVVRIVADEDMALMDLVAGLPIDSRVSSVSRYRN
ncbi:MAG TPA: STAS domain-containing protein [bacterium]|jgi:anti-anti-sigma factor